MGLVGEIIYHFSAITKLLIVYGGCWLGCRFGGVLRIGTRVMLQLCLLCVQTPKPPP